MQQIAQMHKIRQQHQNFSSHVLHTNNNNNNNSNKSSNNYHQHYRNNNNTTKHLQYTQQQDKSQQQQPKYLPPNPTNVPQTPAAHMGMIQQATLPPPNTHAPLHQHQPHFHHAGPPPPPQQQPQPQYYAHANPAGYHMPPPPPPPQGNDAHVIVAPPNVQNAPNAQPCGAKQPPPPPPQQQHQVYLGVPHGGNTSNSNKNNNNMRHYNYPTTAEGMPFKPVSAVIAIPPKQLRANGRQPQFNRNKMSQNNNNINTINYNNNNNRGHDYYNKYNKSPKNGNVTTNGVPMPTISDNNSAKPFSEGPNAPTTISENFSTSDPENNKNEAALEAPNEEKAKSVEIHSEEMVKVAESQSKNDQTEASPNSDRKENDSLMANRNDNNNKTNNSILSNEDFTVTNSNGKEKTPMCLVNELARFNKIVHQYRLTSENGPAHSKRFTVTLKLGDEEYTAEGFKIKKAQHLAAATAIEKTKYKHPTPKVGRRGDDTPGSRPNITPTVELNALAMKLGQQTFYVMDPQDLQRDPRGSSPLPDAVAMPPPYAMVPPPGTINVGGVHVLGPPPPMPPPAVGYMRRGANGFVAPPPLLPPYNNYARYGQRGYPGGHVGRHGLMSRHHMGYAAIPTAPQTPTKITLFVGNQKFVGTGRTLQQAKHDAAGRALEVLKAQAELQRQELANQKESADESADLKSPISLVHELAIRRGMTIVFKVLREEGPAHMKNFVTACICGTIITEGYGNGKRVSKKRAAEKMLVELRKLPPVTPTVTPIKRGGRIKTKGALPSGGPANKTDSATPNEKSGARKRLLKEPADTDNDLNNPITCLIQLQQTRKEKEPEFIMIGKNGNENARRREFIYEVSAEGMTARGLGTSKKLAKRNAAENLLIALGVEVPAAVEGSKQTPPKASTKKPSVKEDVEPPQETNTNDEAQESNGGILIQRQPKKKTETPKKKEKPPTNEAIAEESVKAVEEEPSIKTSDKERPKTAMGVQSKQQLLYLAKILDFQVAFSDYPKGNHSEFLSIVTLTTNPPQICHGVGGDSEESQNDAARNALKILSDLGIGGSAN